MIGNVVLDNDINSTTISELHNMFKNKYIPELTSGTDYLYKNPLVKLEEGDNGWYGPDNKKILDIGETFIVEDIYIIGQGMIISGERDKNQTVVIRGCRFSGSSWSAIDITGVDNIIFEGNYIHDIGMVSNIRMFKTLKFRYNKIKDHASMIRSGAYGSNCITFGSAINVTELDISYNLIDSTYSPEYVEGMSVEDRHGITYKTDWINLRYIQMKPGVRGHVHHNIESGSITVGESGTSCGIVCDRSCIGIDIHDNYQLNAGQSLIGSASSHDIRVYNNKGIHTNAGSAALSISCQSTLTLRDDGKMSTYKQTFALDINAYMSSDGTKLIDELVDVYGSGVHICHDNNMATYRSSTLENGATTGRVNSIPEEDIINIENDAVGNFYLHNNTFRPKKNEDGTVYRYTNDYDHGVDKWYTYLVLEGEPPTPDEMYQTIYGVNEGDNTRDGNGNSLMHIKHGTPQNSVYYFKLDREII